MINHAFSKSVTVPKSPEQLVEAHAQIAAEINAAYDALERADALFDATFNDRPYPAKFSYDYRMATREEKLLALREKAWRFLFDLSGAVKLVSAERKKAFETQCEEKSLPPFSLEEVSIFLEGLQNGAVDLAKETVTEVFNMLRPGAYHRKYKTNAGSAKWKLGKKVILSNRVRITPWGEGKMEVNTSYEDELIRLDRVFHLLDGKGVPKGYRSPLVDAINTSQRSEEGETDYFIFRAYKNGSLHLSFKRFDLVNQINAIAGVGENVLGG